MKTKTGDQSRQLSEIQVAEVQSRHCAAVGPEPRSFHARMLLGQGSSTIPITLRGPGCRGSIPTFCCYRSRAKVTIKYCLSVSLITGRRLGFKLGPKQDAQTTLLTAHNASCLTSLAVSNAGQVPRRSRPSDSLDRERLLDGISRIPLTFHLQTSLAGMSSRLTGMQSLLAMACVLIIIGATTTSMCM